METSEIKQKLLQEISKTEKLIIEYRELTQPVAPDEAIGRISRMDAINNKSVTEASLRKAEQKLESLTRVLSMYGTSEFGRCLKCKAEIPFGRILIPPRKPVLYKMCPIMKTVTCPLCQYPAFIFYKQKSKTYYLCSECSGIFLERNLLPGWADEIARYEEHNNDVEDVRYQKFVSPIVSQILDNYCSEDAGLDFGAGTGPVISKLLDDKGYDIVQYDPFFHNYPDLLQKTYDYIACCEVIEHFHHPYKEFERLKGFAQK
jgi:RNA polymerase-binding transcription factor DksA